MKKVSGILLILVVAISLLVIPAAVVGANPDPALAGKWHLDEGVGTTAADSSGNNNHGTVQGATWSSDAKSGKALSFNGTGDYVEFPASSQILDTCSFTALAWFKTDYNHPVYGSGEGRILNLHRKEPAASSTTAISLYVEQDRIGLLYYTGTGHVWLKYDAAYSDDEWHQIAVTYDCSTYKLYFDGVMVTSRDDAFEGFGTIPAYLGTYNSGERFFKGLIDEVGIWARTLSAEEIAALTAPFTPMTKFAVKHATINFTNPGGDDSAQVMGEMELDLANGNGVDISEDVTVTLGSLSETFTMREQRGRGKKWEYKRGGGGQGGVKHLTIDWRKGEFNLKIDNVDLGGMTNPSGVNISIQIGNDLGETAIDMKEKKRWYYNTHRHKESD